MGDPNMLDWRLFLLLCAPAVIGFVWAALRRRRK